MAEQTLQVQALSREGVTFLSEQIGEAGPMRQRREEAWRFYLESPFPNSNTDEPWRRTDTRALVRRLDKLSPAPQSALAESIESLPEAMQAVLRESDKRGGLLVRRDNGVVYFELDEEYIEQGVLFMDLNQALREHPELVEKYLFQLVKPEEGKFQTLHAALVNGGAFLYVPRGVVVERALQVIHWVDTTDTLLFPHTLVVLEEEAQATVMDDYLSEVTGGSIFVNSAVELHLASYSTLIYLSIQNWAQNVTHFNFSRAAVGASATLNWTVGQFGGKLTRFQTEADMVGSGGSALLNGVFFPTEGQQHGNYTLQHHKATHCTSDLLYKGALLGKCRSVYEGGIKVAKGAQQTDAYQANRNLMLSRSAHADSIPQLEIEAHEVRCTHGSTTSQMDQEELFYLQSRGIDKDPATKLIVEGFYVPVLDRIPLREVRARLKAAIQSRMSS
ncbi:MAG: Fe-S cluster assembly protein SufD [Ardenticatenales bacterium]|nr:Fe-S cluster assembly protein SufD [Ardenticatenales bacterium]